MSEEWNQMNLIYGKEIVLHISNTWISGLLFLPAINWTEFVIFVIQNIFIYWFKWTSELD